MKTIFLNYKLLCFILIATSHLFSQPPEGYNGQPGGPNNGLGIANRSILWVSGLGGDPVNTWSKARLDINNRYYVFGHPCGEPYNDESLEGAGQDLAGIAMQKLSNTEPGSAAPFVIAHSQGGLVARSADYAIRNGNFGTQQYFEGIVTFGTPHLGAPIVSKFEDMINMFREGCSELIKGPIAEWNDNHFLLSLFLSNSKLNAIGQTLCNVVADGALPALTADLQTNITMDYNPFNEGAFLHELHSDELNSTQHKVAFYGLEEEPIFHRQVASFLKSPESFPIYSADPDNEVIEKLDKLSNDYLKEYKYNLERKKHYKRSALAGLSLLQPYWALIANIKANGYGNTAEEYLKGYNYLLSLNDKWKIIIGIAEYQEIEIGGICKCESYGASGDLEGVSTFWTSDRASCESLNVAGDWTRQYAYFPEFETNFVQIDQSDAVVPAQSAQNFPGCLTTNRREMLKSNHQQMRNDSNTKLRLDELLYGASGTGIPIYDPFFQTPIK
ncbi:MAG: hypothetical protein IPG95_08255 [Saprospiraceae bacterium]|nr:hypothetical protein [Saprospiraceae bacterium]